MGTRLNKLYDTIKKNQPNGSAKLALNLSNIKTDNFNDQDHYYNNNDWHHSLSGLNFEDFDNIDNPYDVVINLPTEFWEDLRNNDYQSSNSFNVSISADSTLPGAHIDLGQIYNESTDINEFAEKVKEYLYVGLETLNQIIIFILIAGFWRLRFENSTSGEVFIYLQTLTKFLGSRSIWVDGAINLFIQRVGM